VPKSDLCLCVDKFNREWRLSLKENVPSSRLRVIALMKFTLARIDCNRIADWDSFHDVFSDAFGFPGFYGRNMNAWIDCMTYLDEPDAEMTAIHAPETGCLVLQLDNVKPLAARDRDIYDAIIECTAFVNWRRMEKGDRPVLMLSFYG